MSKKRVIIRHDKNGRPIYVPQYHDTGCFGFGSNRWLDYPYEHSPIEFGSMYAAQKYIGNYFHEKPPKEKNEIIL